MVGHRPIYSSNAQTQGAPSGYALNLQKVRSARTRHARHDTHSESTDMVVVYMAIAW